MKITAADFERVVRNAVNQRMQISNRDQFIKENHIMLPFVPKEAETDYLYEEGPDPVDGKLQAITSKQRKEAFDKFVIDWRKQNSLEGTDVMPPTEVVPLWMRRAESPNKNMTIAHTPHTPESTYDDYGRPERVPRYKGGNPGGQQIEIPWMKEEYKKKHPQLEQLHNEKYHQAMAGPDYIGDKLRYGQLDRILNPFNDFRKPTLDQLRIHSKAYPKAT